MDAQPSGINNCNSVMFTISKSDSTKYNLNIFDKKKVNLVRIPKYVLRFEYEDSIIELKTNLNNPIRLLLEEIYDMFEIQNIRDFDFYVRIKNEHYKNLNFLKLHLVDTLFNKYENEFQKVEVLIIINHNSSNLTFLNRNGENNISSYNYKTKFPVYSLSNTHTNLVNIPCIQIKKNTVILNFDSINSLVNFYSYNKFFKCNKLKIKVKFIQNEVLILSSLLNVINLFFTNFKNNCIDVYLDINAVVECSEYDFNQSNFNMISTTNTDTNTNTSVKNLKSLKIKDNLYSFSKNFNLFKFLCIFMNVNESLKKLKLENFKFTSYLSIYYFFFLISITSKNLKVLNMKNNKIELEQKLEQQTELYNENYIGIPYIQLDNGINVIISKDEKFQLISLKKLKLKNTKILSLLDLSKNSYDILGKIIKFDKNSILDENIKNPIAIDYFNKTKTTTMLYLNESYFKCYFNGIKNVISTVNELTLTDLNIGKKSDVYFSFFEDCLTRSDLLELKKITFKRCNFRNSDTLTEIITNGYKFENLRRIYLNNIYQVIDIDILKFNENRIDNIEIKDSFIKLINRININNLSLNTLKISLSMSMSLISNQIISKEEYKQTLDSLCNILNSSSKIDNLILEKQAFILLREYINISRLKNLVINKTQLEIENFKYLLCQIHNYTSSTVSFNKIQNLTIFKSVIILNSNYKLDLVAPFRKSHIIIHIDYYTLFSTIFNQEQLSSLCEFFNICMISNDDNLIKNQKEKTILNLQFIKFLFDLTSDLGCLINIYYQTEDQLSEILILFHLKRNEKLFIELMKLKNEKEKWTHQFFIDNFIIGAKNTFEKDNYLIGIKQNLHSDRNYYFSIYKNFNFHKIGRRLSKITNK